MAVMSLASLVVQQGKTAFYNKALALASSLGLPVSTWHAGDPTRSLYHLEAEILAAFEPVAVRFIRAGFLGLIAELASAGDSAANEWLKIRAKQSYNVDVPEATYASTEVILSNAKGYYYPIEPGDLTFKNSTSGKTYHNTTGGTLASGPGTTLTVTVEADEPGSDSSAAAGEIDTLVTARIGVTCTNPTAAVGLDEQAPATTVQQCLDKLDSLSPNGPKGVFSFISRKSELTGTNAVTRVRVYDDSDTGDVLVYLADASGGVSETVRALVETAILTWATGVCITPTVSSATEVVVPVSYTLWIYKTVNKTAAEIEEEVEAALEALFAGREIGGDIIPPAEKGKLYRSLVESTIRSLYPEAFRVSLSFPEDDVELENFEVATLGTVTATINVVSP